MGLKNEWFTEEKKIIYKSLKDLAIHNIIKKKNEQNKN